MPKTLSFILIFLISVFGLVAQTSSRDFYVEQPNSGYLGNYSNWDEFVKAMYSRVEEQQQEAKRVGFNARFEWVPEPTRMENELVSIAYQELPDTTKIGSAYLIMLRSYNNKMFYNVYIYSDQDGKRYYLLLRMVLYLY